MYEDMDPDVPSRKNRRVPATRAKNPRAKSSTRNSKKSATGFGGVHRRRNKHWSW
jgi:hypothetical protein